MLRRETYVEASAFLVAGFLYLLPALLNNQVFLIMKIKTLIVALFFIPFISQAVSIPKGYEVIKGEVYDYVSYVMYDTETVESVAQKFRVPESHVITDVEGSVGGDWRRIMVVVRGTPPGTQTQTESPVKEKRPILRHNEKTVPVSTTTEPTVDAETVEKENEQLKTQIALLQQLISLLKTLAGLKQ